MAVTVNAVNDQPVASDDTDLTDEDTAISVAAGAGVISNDTDIDGDLLSVSAVVGGTVGVQFALPSGALLTLETDMHAKLS